MSYIKQLGTNLNPSIETRNLDEIENLTGNIYESIVIVSKRANQLGVMLKEELNAKLREFESTTDNMEEVFENREQIEISRFYEKLPHPVNMSLKEFMDGQIYNRRRDEAK